MSAVAKQDGTAGLPCNTLVIRVLLKKSWIDEDQKIVLTRAYMPRSNGKDDEGFSIEIVDFSSCSTLVEGAMKAREGFVKSEGAASLHTGKVRDLNQINNRQFDIVSDPQPDKPKHGLIKGTPRYAPDNLIEQEHVATLLARLSRVIPDS